MQDSGALRDVFTQARENAALFGNGAPIGCLHPEWGITPASFTIVNVLGYNLALLPRRFSGRREITCITLPPQLGKVA